MTPAEILKDIAALDRMEHNWLAEGRLDSDTEADLIGRKADLMDKLRERFNTAHESLFRDCEWAAWEGDMDYDHNGERFVPCVPIGYGKTEVEAIERLLELLGEDE